jgi:hypothetical protein
VNNNNRSSSSDFARSFPPFFFLFAFFFFVRFLLWEWGEPLAFRRQHVEGCADAQKALVSCVIIRVLVWVVQQRLAPECRLATPVVRKTLREHDEDSP